MEQENQNPQNQMFTVYIVIGVAFGVLLVLMLILTSRQISLDEEAINGTVDALVGVALTEAGISGTSEAQSQAILTDIAVFYPTPTATATVTPSPTPLPTPVTLPVDRTEFLVGAASFASPVIAWSGDGTALAGGNQENGLVIGTLSDGRTAVIGETGGIITAIDWSQDNRRIALADGANNVFIRDLQSGGGQTPTTVLSPVRQLAWSPDGQRLAGITADNLYLWDISLIELEVVPLVNTTSNSVSLSWSPDGTQLAFSTGNRVSIIEIVNGEFTRSRVLLDVVNPSFVAFSPDSESIAVVDGLGISIFDAGEAPALRLSFPAHVDTIHYVSWSPNSRYLVSSGADGMARVWDAASGLQLYILLHQASVTMAEWSPDGSLLATKERNVFLWGLPIVAGTE